MAANSPLSIWFFLRSLLLLLGVVTTASGLIDRDTAHHTIVFSATPRADIFWGLFLLAAGATSFIRFFPKNTDKLP